MFSVKSGNPLSLIMSVPNNFSTYSREATVQLFTFHLHIKQSRTFLITNLSNIKTKIFFKKSNASNVFTFLFCLFHLIDTFLGFLVQNNPFQQSLKYLQNKIWKISKREVQIRKGVRTKNSKFNKLDGTIIWNRRVLPHCLLPFNYSAVLNCKGRGFSSDFQNG